MPDISTSKARKDLPARREPHWCKVPGQRGLFLGYRRMPGTGSETWLARYRFDGEQNYAPIGRLDEFDFDAAAQKAVEFGKKVTAGVGRTDIETVADACRDYVAALEKGERVATAKDTARRFERTVYRDRIGPVALQSIRKHHIRDWFARIESGALPALPATKGRPPRAKPLSKTTANRMRTALVAALNRAVEEEYVSAEFAKAWNNVKPHKAAGGRRELYLDVPQRRALLEHAAPDVRDLMECVVLTGCRPGDPAAMLRKDYDAKSGRATFRTKGHERTVRLSPQAKALFDRLARDKLPAAPLFTNAGRTWTPKEWGVQVREAVDAAGLPAGVVLYTLRHGWITDAIVGGLDLLTVAKLAGTSLAMIEKHYGHLVINDALDSKLAAVQML